MSFHPHYICTVLATVSECAISIQYELGTFQPFATASSPKQAKTTKDLRGNVLIGDAVNVNTVNHKMVMF